MSSSPDSVNTFELPPVPHILIIIKTIFVTHEGIQIFFSTDPKDKFVCQGVQGIFSI